MKLIKSRAAAVAAGATVLVVLSGTGGAVATGLVGSPGIRDNGVRSVDLRDGGVHTSDLADGIKAALAERAKDGVDGIDGTNGVDGRDGAPGLANLESDGPYPGATNLTDGDNSTSYWTSNGLQQSWVRCAGDKVALGGGFTLAADASLADKEATKVFTSQPVQIENGDPTVYTPIEGDVDGSFVPNGWLVEGTYSGSNPTLVVRPHVICATVGK